MEPLRHQLEVLPPLEEQPILTNEINKATEQNKTNFFMVKSPGWGMGFVVRLLKGYSEPTWSARHSTTRLGKGKRQK